MNQNINQNQYSAIIFQVKQHHSNSLIRNIKHMHNPKINMSFKRKNLPKRIRTLEQLQILQNQESINTTHPIRQQIKIKNVSRQRLGMTSHVKSAEGRNNKSLATPAFFGKQVKLKTGNQKQNSADNKLREFSRSKKNYRGLRPKTSQSGYSKTIGTIQSISSTKLKEQRSKSKITIPLMKYKITEKKGLKKGHLQNKKLNDIMRCLSRLKQKRS